MISPCRTRATSMARSDLPVAVAPVITRASGAVTDLVSTVATEAPFQLRQRKANDSSAAVHIVVGQRRGEEAVEQVEHLTLTELLPGLDGPFAGKRHGNALMLIVRSARQLAACGEFTKHVTQTALGIEVRVWRWCALAADGGATKRFDLQAHRPQ